MWSVSFDYRGVIAAVVAAVIIWIVIILYRVLRGGAIKRVDFWKSQWKIVLFWFVVALIAAAVWYLGVKYGWWGKT